MVSVAAYLILFVCLLSASLPTIYLALCCLSLSVCLCLLFICVFVYTCSIFANLSAHQSLSVCLCLLLLSICLYISLCVAVCISVSVYLCVCSHCPSVCVYNIPVCLPAVRPCVVILFGPKTILWGFLLVLLQVSRDPVCWQHFSKMSGVSSYRRSTSWRKCERTSLSLWCVVLHGVGYTSASFVQQFWLQHSFCYVVPVHAFLAVNT